jgi:hypothetical protein
MIAGGVGLVARSVRDHQESGEPPK